MKKALFILTIILIQTEFLFGQTDFSNFVPDTSICGIVLHDSISYKLKFKEYPNYKIDFKGPGARICLTNINDTELLTLIFHAGGDNYNVAEIIVDNLDFFKIGESETYKLKDSHFKTENSIKLGLSKEKIINLKGNSFIESYNEEQNTIIYSITFEDTFDYLCRHNMPEYYERFVFVEDKLVQFSFGFTYP